MNPVATETFTIRQTHLRALEETCPAMAYALAVEGREGPSTRGALRGTAVHDVFARYVAHLFESGRQTDWDGCRGIALETLTDYPELNFSERKDVLDQAENIGAGFLFEAAHHYGSEERFATTLECGGRDVEITGRIDLLEASIPEGWARITDCKSNHSIPADSAVREDFQLMTYALLALDNLPPVVDTVKGTLWLTRYNIRVPQKGEAVWTREELEGFRAHLENRLSAFLAGKLSREFVPGTHCQYCPRRRPGDCTHWRRSGAAPTIQNAEQARRLAARIVADEQRLDAAKDALKEYVKAEGPVAIGSTAKAETFDFYCEEHTSYDALCLMAALERLADQVGPQPLGKLLKVDKQAKEFRALMKLPDFRAAMTDAKTLTYQTRFKHKHVAEEVEDAA